MKKENVTKVIFTVGIIPVLYILKDLEKKERYEDCAVIKSVIDNFNYSYNETIPTTINGLNVGKFINGNGLRYDSYKSLLPGYITKACLLLEVPVVD